MTRVMVHEVMHDTTVVKVKKTASRMRTSGGMAKFECVHLGPICKQGLVYSCLQNHWVFTVVVGEGYGT